MVIESLAYGLPVIVSKNVGSVEAVKCVDDRLILEKLDRQCLEASLNYLNQISDGELNELRRRCGEAASRFSISNYASVVARAVETFRKI